LKISIFFSKKKNLHSHGNSVKCEGNPPIY
jgi:hypothetical protein